VKEGLIIIPAYNEEGAILKTVENIKKEASKFDCIVINDCSTDETEKILVENNINHILLPINSGIGGAVQTGYLYAKRYGYAYAVQMDGDGQHDASYLDDMINEMINQKADMVIGSRFIKKEGFQSSGLRRMGIGFFAHWIKILTGHSITDATSGMRLINRRVIEIFANSYPRDYPEPESVTAILKSGFKVIEVPVKMRARETGKSSISMRKSIYYMIKVSLACLFA
jgi:glycosyltransferase involved in cell wall biosynthesis